MLHPKTLIAKMTTNARAHRPAIATVGDVLNPMLATAMKTVLRAASAVSAEGVFPDVTGEKIVLVRVNVKSRRADASNRGCVPLEMTVMMEKPVWTGYVGPLVMAMKHVREIRRVTPLQVNALSHVNVPAMKIA